jgi:hypothetical protein
VKTLRIVEADAIAEALALAEDFTLDLARRQGFRIARASPGIRASQKTRVSTEGRRREAHPVASEQKCVGGATYGVVGKHPPKI